MGLYIGNTRYKPMVGSSPASFMVKKPYDAEIEYLESTGTQYIDTSVYGSHTLKTEIKIEELEIATAKATFGAFGNSNKCYYCYQSGVGNRWQVGFASYGNTSVYTSTLALTWLFDNYNIYIDDELIYTGTASEFTTPHTLLLFNMHNNSGGIYSSVPKRVYFCKMWNNGTLIHDFIPVRVGTTGYMYDRVSGELFGNAGTGSFVLGRDKGLPYDAEIEYLESTNQQWIDSGIQYQDKIKVEATIDITPSNAEKQIFGSNRAANTGSFIVGTYTRFFYAYNRPSLPRIDSAVYNQELTNVTVIYEADSDFGRKFTVNNILYTASTVSFNSENIFVFCGGPSTSYAIAMKLRSFKISVNNALVFDGIPVRVGQVGYLYDRVSKKLFGNSGTDDFVLGPDV